MLKVKIGQDLKNSQHTNKEILLWQIHQVLTANCSLTW